MPTCGTDTSGLHAILDGEKRRATIVCLESASFIDVHTVQRLRRAVFADGVVDQSAAETLFAVERRGISTCPEWRDFFIEAIVQHVLWLQRPTGALTDAQAEWLLGQADRARTFAAFAILVAVLEEADAVPPWFVAAVRTRAEQGWPGLAAAAVAA